MAEAALGAAGVDVMGESRVEGSPGPAPAGEVGTAGATGVAAEVEMGGRKGREVAGRAGSKEDVCSVALGKNGVTGGGADGQDGFAGNSGAGFAGDARLDHRNDEESSWRGGAMK